MRPMASLTDNRACGLEMSTGVGQAQAVNIAGIKVIIGIMDITTTPKRPLALSSLLLFIFHTLDRKIFLECN